MVEIDADIDLAVGTDAVKKKDKEKTEEIKGYDYRVIYAKGTSTDNNGNIPSFTLADIPDGHSFFPYRIMLWSDGHNPGSAFSAATAYLGLYHGSPAPVNLADYWPKIAGGQLFPLMDSYSTSSGPEFRWNDNPVFSVKNGPANTNITVIMFGELRDLKVLRRTLGRG